MRCEKMHATIKVAQCLKNQTLLSTELHRGPNMSELRYIGCKDCSVGADARAGRLNDGDVDAIFRELHLRRNPPPLVTGSPRTTVIPQVSSIEFQASTKEEGVQEEATKKCVRCGQVKPLEEMLADKNAKDGRKSVCKACNRVRQLEFCKKARAKRKAKDELLEKLKAASAIQEAGEDRHPPLPEAFIQEETKPAKIAMDLGAGRDRTSVFVGFMPSENHLTLDFSPYPEILAEIKRIAADEERPAEVQARFMLRRMLKNSCPAKPGYQPVFIDAGGECPDRGIPIIDPPEDRMGPPQPGRGGFKTRPYEYQVSTPCA